MLVGAVPTEGAAIQIVVVADNCHDATGERARDAGATVLVRNDATLRGKGYALKHAFESILEGGPSFPEVDAVVVVDADTRVSPNLLAAFSARFDAGAKAVQAEYGVSNPRASWRTRLMVIALAMFHGVRSIGRERLGVSSGLRGNGMGFSSALLREVPHEAFSIVEDIEYGIRIGRAGYPVRFVSEAYVLGEMVSSEKASRSQRERWEGGRIALAKQHGLPLLKDAFASKSLILFDLAMDVLVPPLTYVAFAAVFGTIVSFCLILVSHAFVFALLAWGTALAMLAVYVGRGVALSNMGLRGVLDLAWAPIYMVWKVALSLSGRRRRTNEWVRTAREADKSSK